MISYAQLYSVYRLNQSFEEYSHRNKTTERKYLWKEEDLCMQAWEHWRKNTEPLKDEVLCESEWKSTLALRNIKRK